MATPCDRLSNFRSSSVTTNALSGDTNPEALTRDLVISSKDRIYLTPNDGLGADSTNMLLITGTTNMTGSLAVDDLVFSQNQVSTSTGDLRIQSNSGAVKVDNVVFTNASLTPGTDVDLSLTGGATSAVVVESVRIADNAIGVSTDQDLTIQGGSTHSLVLESVKLTDNAVTVVGDVDLTLTAGATKSVVVEGVKITDNAVTTSSGQLTLSSAGAASNALQVGGVTVTDASVSSSTGNGNLTLASNGTGSLLLDNVKVKTSGITNNVTNADLSLTSNGTGAVLVDNVRVKTSGISNNVTNADLSLTSNGTGSVLVDNVKVKTSGITNNVTNADLTLTSNGTGSVVIDSVKVKTAGITTSSGTLALTSAGASTNQVNVGGLTVTNGSIGTIAATTVTVAKDLTLTSTAGGSGKVTTSAGNLELTSTSGTVAVTGALTGSSTITSTGNVVVGADLKVAGVIDSTNASGNLEILDKTVKLGYQPGSVTVFDFPFTTSAGGTTPNSVSNAVASMTLGGTATVSGGSLVIPAASGANIASTGSFSNSLVNWSTDNFILEFPITISSALTSTSGTCTIVRIENFTPSNLYLRFYAKPNGVLYIAGPEANSDQVGFLNSAGTYLIRLSFEWSGGVCLGTFTYSKDGGATTPITFSSSPTLNVTTYLSNCQTCTVALGNNSGTPNQSYTYDYFKLTKGATATNTPSDSAGIYVDGSASYSSRALTWHMGAGETSQDKATTSGSYWHFEGGQLMFSRTIEASDREAPGTNVSLASLSSGSDDVRWEFTTNATSEVGSKTLTLNNSAVVQNGVLKIDASGTQSATCNTSLPTGTFSLIMKVIPRATFASANANGLTIMSYTGGSAATTVTVSSAGKLTVSDGTTSAETASVVAYANPFVLAVVRNGSSTVLYVDGVSVATIASSVDVGATPTLRLGPGKNQANYAVWFDDVRLKSTAITDANTQLYGWREMYNATQTVTYGFRIANNESLQLVKVRGSGGSNGWVGINPAPNTVTGSNSLGTIIDTPYNLISEQGVVY